MSGKSGRRERGEYRDRGRGSYGDITSPGIDDEPLVDDDWLADSEAGDFVDKRIAELLRDEAREEGEPAGKLEGGRSLAPFQSGDPTATLEGDETRGLLSSTLSERLDVLRERIESLQRQIAERGELHQAFQDAIRAELEELDHLLGHVRIWSLGVAPSVDGRRTNLERETIGLKKTGWEETLRHWRDIAWMEKELQDAVERYKLAKAAEGLPGRELNEEMR